jgi:site-specific recombinase XerD
MKNKYYLQLLEGFTEWLTRLNYAKESVRGRSRQLRIFLEWIEDKGINELQDITQNDVEAYNESLHKRPIRSRTIEGYISVLKLVNEYLENYGEAPIIKTRLTVTKEAKRERTILSKAEINQLYEACENDPWGLRDRIIIAIYYGCGVRCTEGTRLELRDIDFSNDLLHVRKGKNYRERYVPISEGVKKELLQWVNDGQTWFAGEKTNILIPNSRGKTTQSGPLNKRLKLLCEKASINKKITLHCLRHSIATHLLESGMDLEMIGQFLGHVGLEATQVYTRITNGNK